MNPAQVTADPVLAAFELPLRRTFFPLGCPLVLETNSRNVILAAEEFWGASERMFDRDPVRICLGVSEDASGLVAPAPVIRAREHLMSIVAGPENFMLCDFYRGFAFGWVTRSTAADRALLRYQFLAAGGIALVQQRAFAPLHGALVMRDGAGVMFCGNSLAGKSTLAYACARAGWTYVSDDGTFLVRDRDDRYAIGDSHNIRFRIDAAELFPELADHIPVVRPNGKLAIELCTRDLGIATAQGGVVDHVVFLDRERWGPPSIHDYPDNRALEYWAQYTVLGAGEERAAQRRCLERLLQAGVWKMQYSNLDDAVARLERLIGEGA
ncbi:MAG: hypothetical protein ABSG13_09890 [Bryobacteraceae bacterium]